MLSFKTPMTLAWLIYCMCNRPSFPSTSDWFCHLKTNCCIEFPKSFLGFWFNRCLYISNHGSPHVFNWSLSSLITNHEGICFCCSVLSKFLTLTNLTKIHFVAGVSISILTFRKSLKGTNCTMSRTASSPVLALKTLASPSRNSMAAKSALPTPMMMMDMGSLDACTMASRVSSISLMTPSVMMRSVKYCCRGEERMRKQRSKRKCNF